MQPLGVRLNREVRDEVSLKKGMEWVGGGCVYLRWLITRWT